MARYSKLEELHSIYGTGFYLFHVEQLRKNYQRLIHAFSTRYKKVKIGYSYKTNYLPYLCQQVNRLGAVPEVVSHLEYQLAVKIADDPKQIIFNGPLKTYEDIKLALDNKSTVNLDSWHEIEHVRKYHSNHPGKEIKIGLRVNFDLRQGGVSPLANGYPVSRFGFCVENGSFQTAINRLREIPGVTIVGLHGHFSSNRSVDVYRRITWQLCQLAKQYLPDEVEYIDIGGGFYGELPSSFQVGTVPSFDDYAEVICSTMNQEWSGTGKLPVLILEPGICLTADTFEYVCKVIDVKENNGETFVLVDGSIYTIKPTMHRFSLPFEMVREEARQERELKTYHIVGFTCMERDYLIQDHYGILPQRNDYLIFSHVGAYTTVLHPPFIRERPPIVAVENEQFFLVRKREEFEDFFAGHHDLFCDQILSER